MKENEVRKLMRSQLKESSFKLWRERVKGRKPNIHRQVNQKDLNQKIKNKTTMIFKIILLGWTLMTLFFLTWILKAKQR